MRSSRSRLFAALSLAVALAGFTTAARAQSLTAGSLRGTVLTPSGEPVSGAQVALEGEDGGTIRLFETDRDGGFAVSLLAPGTYRLLIEQVGFQPIRRLGVTIRAGQATSIAIEIERRPPPIASVVEIEGSSPSAGFIAGRLVSGREMREFEARRDVTDAVRGATELVTPNDGRQGLAVAGLGRLPSLTRLFVDGLPEALVRHPGMPGEPATAPLFARDGMDQAQVMHMGLDAEWRGVTGSAFSGQSRRGGNLLSFQPWFRASSAALGGSSELNPADSSGTSLGLGAVISGALVPDTVQFLIRGEYQSLKTPTAFPWANDEGQLGGLDASIREAIVSIGDNIHGASLAAAVNPVVRTWKGGDVSGRLDWILSPNHAMMFRAGFASWKEEHPLLGRDAGNDAGAGLDARDFSGAITLTSSGPSLANELRAGFGGTKREWLAAPRPSTLLGSEGVRIGGNPALPGLFDQKNFSFTDALQFGFGRHTLKLGAGLDYTSYEQNYRYGSAGVFLFGNLDGFANGDGFYLRAVGAEAGAKFSWTEPHAFLEDSWAVMPSLQVLLGVRYQTQTLPGNKLVRNTNWSAASGISTDVVPSDRSGIGPRAGFVWDVQNRGEWIVRGGGGLFHAAMRPTHFAEAVLGGSAHAAVRGEGAVGWPTPAPGTLISPALRLALFTEDYKAPRTFKAELGVTRAMASGFTLQIAGGYYHTDYLLRRNNLNRLQVQVAETDEGRPVYGGLAKRGGLLQATPGSNRRFEGFDIVSAFVPTGYSDHYELTAALERRVSRSLSVVASYTFSRTTDNLVGAVEPDPFDQLSPFPDGLGGNDWTDGRSDFDVPHRVAATFEYKSTGTNPVVVSARGRWRSGLPFTPGFRPGVDANGDGGGNNDPAFLDPDVPDLAAALSRVSCSQGLTGQFAERNGCREKAVLGLDLGVKVALPFAMGSGRRLALSADAINLVSTSTGVIDHALVLVNPSASLGAPVGGVYTLPLVANPNFGAIQSRRGEPRLIRIGLGIEY